MSSIRSLKKDINYLTNEVVEDCVMASYFHPKKEEEIKTIISSTLDTRSNLLQKINERKQNKAGYKAIAKELLEKSDEAFDALSKLIEQEK